MTPLVFPDGYFLARGIHSASVGDVKDALVDEFPTSRTRRPIFADWIGLRDEITQIAELRKQWVNGSFVSKKTDPNDIDVATFLNSEEIDGLASSDKDALNALLGGSATESFPRCDSFAIVEYPENHQMYDVYLATKETFQTSFYSYDVEKGVEKGFLEVE